MPQSTIVFEGISFSQLDRLVEKGFIEQKVKNRYERRRLKRETATAILYSSGKLVLSGPDTVIAGLRDVFGDNEPIDQGMSRTKGSSYERTRDKSRSGSKTIPDAECVIGSDETLKGDTFGGIIVCACRICSESKPFFREAGVIDSKELNDKQITRIASHLLESHPDSFCCIELSPESYNEHMQSHSSSTKLLDKLHSQATEALREEGETSDDVVVIVDKYPGCKVGDVIVERAESVSIAVAAASIVARYKGIEQFKRLSREAGFKLPFGSTHVTGALERIKRENLEHGKFCKLHFSNVKKNLHS
ncbi:MAG: hypothetical protein ACOCZV_00445 [Nanoarchaeota archaeon]